MQYYLIIALQIYCIYQIIKRHHQWWWILFVLFVPVIGCAVYILLKIVNQQKIGQEVNAVQSDLGTIFNPGGKIKELEKQVAFSDTFVNKVALGDAYLVSKMYDKAIEMYESTRKGVHDNDPHVNKQLIHAYFHKHQYDEVIRIAQQAKENKEFEKSNAKVLYALALEQNDQTEEAGRILQSMNGQYSDLEPRIIYAQFLMRQEQKDDAKNLLEEIITEGEHMSNFELKNKRQWIQKAQVELKSLK